MIDAWLSGCLLIGVLLGARSSAVRAAAWAVVTATIGFVLAFETSVFAAFALACSSGFVVQASYMVVAIASALLAPRLATTPRSAT